MKLKLVSFALCPYVQRSVITLNYKKVPFEVAYIDLQNKPDWFLAMSPLGKVPVLQVNDDVVLFESAVINEYIDEITPPSLLAADPLKKAQQRAWIEYGSVLIGLFAQAFYYPIEPQEANQKIANLFDKLRYIENRLPNGDFFMGDQFSLVDTSFAPVLTRIALFADHPLIAPHYDKLAKIQHWTKALLQMDAIQNSVPVDFAELFQASLKNRNSILITTH